MSIDSVRDFLTLNNQTLKSLPKWSDIVEIRTWSDSDFYKIRDLIEKLTQEEVWFLLRIQSAHRMPWDMIMSAQAFPDILLSHYLSDDVRSTIANKGFKVALCIAAAWGSAHIAWMTASETQTPIIAYPVSASVSWQIAAFYSMVDMPPWIPNWVQTDINSIFKIAKKLLELKKSWIRPKVYIPKEIQLWDKIWVINELTKVADLVEIPETANVWIFKFSIDKRESNYLPKDWVNVVIPTVNERITWINMWECYSNACSIHNWLLMWTNLRHVVNYTNSLLYLAQLVSVISWEEAENLLAWLKDYRKLLTSWAQEKDANLMELQFGE